MVYSADGITRAEDLAAQRRLDTLWSFNLKQEYSELCGFFGSKDVTVSCEV